MLVQENQVHYEIDYSSFKDRLRKGEISPSARVASPILTDGEWRSVGDLRLYDRIRKLGYDESELWLAHTKDQPEALSERGAAPVSHLAWLIVGWSYGLSLLAGFAAFGGASSVSTWAPWVTAAWAAIGAGVAICLDQFRLGAGWPATGLTVLAMTSFVIGGASLWLAYVSSDGLSGLGVALAMFATGDLFFAARMFYRLRTTREQKTVDESVTDTEDED
jgi:hypothetical protein